MQFRAIRSASMVRGSRETILAYGQQKRLAQLLFEKSVKYVKITLVPFFYWSQAKCILQSLNYLLRDPFLVQARYYKGTALERFLIF